MLKEPLQGGFFKKAVFIMKIIEYFKETKTELKHVIWPSRRQTFYYTLIVIILSVIVGYYLGIFDFIFSVFLESVVTKQNFFEVLRSRFF